MGAGVSGANVADNWLKVLSGTTFTAPAGVHIKLHTGNPGSAGTANASVETTRKQVDWGAGTPSGQILTASSVPSWTAWPVGADAENIQYISAWSAGSGGNFLFSGQLSVAKTVNTNDTLTLSTLTVAINSASVAS